MPVGGQLESINSVKSEHKCNFLHTLWLWSAKQEACSLQPDVVIPRENIWRKHLSPLSFNSPSYVQLCTHVRHHTAWASCSLVAPAVSQEVNLAKPEVMWCQELTRLETRTPRSQHCWPMQRAKKPQPTPSFDPIMHLRYGDCMTSFGPWLISVCSVRNKRGYIWTAGHGYTRNANLMHILEAVMRFSSLFYGSLPGPTMQR